MLDVVTKGEEEAYEFIINFDASENYAESSIADKVHPF
jgi:hypothetical protein